MAAVPTPVSVPEPVKPIASGCDTVNNYDWDKRIARAVCMAESHGNNEAHNLNHRTKDDSWGLFQINRYGRLGQTRPPADKLTDPEFNTQYAYNLWKATSWNSWGAYTSGDYLKYM